MTTKEYLPDFLMCIPDRSQDIPRAALDIEDKTRSNLFPWNGQFSPQLAEVLIETYSRQGDVIFDPFVGSGTVLLEAARLERPSVGSEINPAAYALASVYELIGLSKNERLDLVSATELGLGPIFKQEAQLAVNGFPSDQIGALHSTLLRHRDALREKFVRIMVDALIVLADIGASQPFRTKIGSSWSRLKGAINCFPERPTNITVQNCDARQTAVNPQSIDFVLTSPPYINVFNYHQQYRKSAEYLGWDLLRVAQSEIGSNRKNRGNRFLTVTQYCKDMCLVFEELHRICRASSRIIFVVGRESRVRGTRFFNGEIVARVALGTQGFALTGRQERSFTNRFGELITEDILHFARCDSEAGLDLRIASDLARDILTSAASLQNPPDVRADIRDALLRIDEVQPSPFFRPQSSQRC